MMTDDEVRASELYFRIVDGTVTMDEIRDLIRLKLRGAAPETGEPVTYAAAPVEPAGTPDWYPPLRSSPERAAVVAWLKEMKHGAGCAKRFGHLPQRCTCRLTKMRAAAIAMIEADAGKEGKANG